MTAPAEQEWLADLGELTWPVVHEVSNFLNSILLHLAVLDHEAPENMRAEFAEIRRQGLELSAMMRLLQDYQSTRQPVPEVVDLNGVIKQAVQELRDAGGPRLALNLTSVQLAVVGSPSDLRRLCAFLVRNAIAAAHVNRGSVTIRTERALDRALLWVEDTGPAVPPAKLAQLFEPHLISRAGMNSLELAACQSLVRRFQGSIRAETDSEVGLRTGVSLPLARE
jgi:signal transduction histidine kinase